MPPTLIVLAIPTFLSAKLALPMRVSTSPASLLESSVTVAEVPPSYTLVCPVAVMVNSRAMMSTSGVPPARV